MKSGLLINSINLQYGFIVSVLLSGCSVTHLSSPKVAAAKDSVDSVRNVTVHVVASPSNGYVPVLQDRIITAEAITTTMTRRAAARKVVQGTETIVVGNSCNQLSLDYQGAYECNEVDAAVRRYGEVETTAITDNEGIVVLKLAATDYRISMQSWQTVEDTKCSWSGSEILPESARVLELPILVYCE